MVSLPLLTLPAEAKKTANTAVRQSAIIKDVRHWAAPESIRLVIDFSGNFSYTARREEHRLVFNIPKAKLASSITRSREIDVDPLRTIILEEKRNGSVELSVLLSRPALCKSFALPPLPGKPARLVVDVQTELLLRERKEAGEQKTALVTHSTISSRARSEKRVVVLDPGHGGEDPGAIGKRGLREKVVTLDISKRIARELSKDPNYLVYLTREGDYYVSFNRRTGLARLTKADVFVSIHADASLNRRAMGASVYVLSLSGASSEAAKLLAQKENLADLIGGVEEAERMEASDAIVLSMFQTHTINSSLFLGRHVLKNLSKVAKLKYKEPQSARFRVLILPDTPSLLVETGFLSNPREEALLRNPTHRQKLAVVITTAIKDFLDASAQ